MRLHPFARGSDPPSPLVIRLLRWLTFRLMLGAGLIKLRGDPCWRDLTCLVFHYETQPNPNPLSWYLHQLPAWFHRLEVLFNHVVELVRPWFCFGPRRARLVAGVLTVLFQVAADRERQPLVPELADDRRGRLVLRRRPAARLVPRGLRDRLARGAWPAWRSASRGRSSPTRSRW